MAYKRVKVDLATGQEIIEEITETQWRCERLGMPDGTPDDVVEAAWASQQSQQRAAKNAATSAEQVVNGAMDRLKAYNPGLVVEALERVEDEETRLILTEINALLADLRLLVTSMAR